MTDWAKGIDISAHNATTPTLRGRSFCFVRACYGSAKDRKWDYHSANVRAAGAILGAYAFGIYGDGREQARAFLGIAHQAELLALDLEKESGKPRMTAGQAADFIATVQDAGIPCGLYHSASSFPSLGQDWNWVAKWTPDGTLQPALQPTIPWAFWQYRGHPLDLDVFNGDEAALSRFARGGNELIKARGSLVMNDGSAAFTKRIRITKDTPLLDSPGGKRLATAKAGYRYPYVGVGDGATRAVLVNTAIPYADERPGPTVLYVAAGATVVEDAPVPPPTGDIEQDVTVTWSVNGQVVGSETFNV